MTGVRWPFRPVQQEMVEVVRAQVPELVARVIRAIADESPAYGEVLVSPEGIAIRIGIERAVVAFLDAAQRGGHPSAETGELWRRLGEAELQAGRGLDALRAAFRIGTRAAWRSAAELAAAGGFETELVIELAEAIFVYTDELAADVVEGYLQAQSDEAGELERRRRRLAVLLLDAEGADPEAVASAAGLARWPLPRTVGVLALATPSPTQVMRRLGVEPLVGSDAGGVFLILPDPEGPGRRTRIERAVGAQVAALGPTVPLRDALRSLRWSRHLLSLLESQVVPNGGRHLARVDQHLADLILLRDAELASALVQARLGPLDQLRGTERERLLDTLQAWLAFQRHTPRVAEHLHVHPQTVRYRITKLRELLGESLDSGDGRFELEMALRARRALPGGPGTIDPLN
jgi:hypothetical protein